MAEAWSGNWCLISPGMAAPAIPMPSPIRTMPPYNPATPSQLRQKIPATARSWNQKMIFHGVIQRATRGEMGAATPSTKTGNRANSPEFSRESPISLSIVPSSGSGESNPVRRLKHTIKKATNSSIFPLMPPEVPALSIPCYTSLPPPLFKSNSLPAVSGPETRHGGKTIRGNNLPAAFHPPCHEKAPPSRRTAAPEHANLLSFHLAGRLPYTSVRLPSQETASIRVEPSG